VNRDGAAPASIDDVMTRLAERRYIGDRPLATSIYLSLQLGKPLFIEGEAGVGKTEAAKVMADVLGARPIDRASRRIWGHCGLARVSSSGSMLTTPDPDPEAPTHPARHSAIATPAAAW